MASVTVYTDFGVQKNKACHCFHCFLIYLPWSNGTGCHDLLGKTRLSRLTFCLPTTGLESAILWGSLLPFIGEWIRDQVLCARFSSVAQLCPTLCNPMECSSPGFPVHHQLLELAQTHVPWVSDAILGLLAKIKCSICSYQFVCQGSSLFLGCHCLTLLVGRVRKPVYVCVV